MSFLIGKECLYPTGFEASFRKQNRGDMRNVAVLSTACVLACSAGFAQGQTTQPGTTGYEPGQFGKPFKKLERMYANGKWEQLAERSKSWRRGKFPKSAEVDYLNAQAHFQLTQTASSATKRDQHLGLALKAWSRAQAKDATGFVAADTLLTSALSTDIEHAALTHYNNGRANRAKVLTKSLARYLNDTIALYTVLYPAPVKASPETLAEVVAPKVIDRSAAVNTKYVVPAIAPTRNDMLSYAKTFEGTPYKWGGESKAGFDCSGFVLHVYQHFGYDFYHNAKEISRLGKAVSVDQMKVGDIACFGHQKTNGNPYVSHVGIVAAVDNNEPKVIHAVNTGVQTDSIAEGSYWNERLLFVRNVVHEPTTVKRSMYGAN